jgi:hypothetical protein
MYMYMYKTQDFFYFLISKNMWRVVARLAPRKRTNKMQSAKRRNQTQVDYPTNRRFDSRKQYSQLRRFSLESGDLLRIDGHWYVTHSGLIRLARRSHCAGIHTEPVAEFSDPSASSWTFKATVYKSGHCRGFIGYGDANPSNVNDLVRGAEMRVAETRAVNRALRKAYGIGLCSVEEIGPTSSHPDRGLHEPPKHPPKSADKGNGTSSTLRDQLTLVIRQHQLDPGLVKLYAADFCGVNELRSASRELIEDFINELTGQAANDRHALVCKLNAYAAKQEGAA